MLSTEGQVLISVASMEGWLFTKFLDTKKTTLKNHSQKRGFKACSLVWRDDSSFAQEIYFITGSPYIPNLSQVCVTKWTHCSHHLQRNRCFLRSTLKPGLVLLMAPSALPAALLQKSSAFHQHLYRLPGAAFTHGALHVEQGPILQGAVCPCSAITSQKGNREGNTLSSFLSSFTWNTLRVERKG